ncbi:hypothetical protein BOTBODRAFT_54187 [Botryobasidium botryosum FD-172 SS1]|uniref:F-box domain-containing protein n=1 Tax=Botryobasidium botryosum (strain FD-172 SS1) TaxID=930990 RepID=A0A067MJT9_BOTB1|nr:hypothetical protein BOTBODRAFT_54187 [Botryobasidium botryosum FD-172 SS1]
MTEATQPPPTLSIDDLVDQGRIGHDHESGMSLSDRLIHNSALPVYRVSSEILFYIFEMAGHNGEQCRVLAKRTPFNVSQVSSFWRSAALNAPTLWTRIDEITAHVGHLYISRSQSALLDIDLDGYGYNPQGYQLSGQDMATYGPAQMSSAASFAQFIQSLRDNIHRWRYLGLNYFNRIQLEQFFFTVAPNLESVKLTHVVDDGGELPADLIKSPRLRHLDFTGMAPPLMAPAYKNLTTLQIYMMTYTEDITQLLWNLTACPLLEQLILDRVQFGSSQALSLLPPTSPAPLLHMRNIGLHDINHGLYRIILSSISLPSTAKLSLWYFIQHSDENHTLDSVVTPALDRETTLPNLSLICHLSFAFDDEFMIVGQGSEDGRMLLEVGVDGQFAASVIRDIAETLPLPYLQSLSLKSVDYAEHVTPFIELLGHWPSITDLYLTGCDAAALLGALTISTALQTLHLRSVTITAALLIDFAGSWITLHGLQPLQGGAELRRIVIFQCPGIGEAIVSTLEDLSFRVDFEV